MSESDEGHAAMETTGADGLGDDVTQMLDKFANWPDSMRVDFIQSLVHQLNGHDQVCLINALSPLLRRDLLLRLPQEISWKILFHLDVKSLCVVSQVNKGWNQLQANSFFWKKLLDTNKQHFTEWAMLGRIRTSLPELEPSKVDWKRQFVSFHRDLEQLARNWSGQNNFQPTETSIQCNGNGIYCLQYDDDKIITGSRDNLVKIWPGPSTASRSAGALADRQCKRQLEGHVGSVLCLQFDDTKVVSGSSDGTVRVWDLKSGECLQTLDDHEQSVLHLKFLGDRLVTCSKDKTVILWKLNREGKYEKIRVMDDHRAAVNVVEFDNTYIVSASGDRSVRIWDTETGVQVQTLKGHSRGIACLQFQGDTIVTGSSDQTLKKWSISEGLCKITLEGHQELVRCVRFNDTHIVSGSYDKTVRIWDFHTGASLRVLEGHQNRVFRVQFDKFKIVSSSQDDQIKIWDFYDPGENKPTGWAQMADALEYGGGEAMEEDDGASAPEDAHA